MVQSPVALARIVNTFVEEFTVHTLVVEEVKVIAAVAVSPALLDTTNVLVLADELTTSSPG